MHFEGCPDRTFATRTEWSLKMTSRNIQLLVVATVLAFVLTSASALRAQNAESTYKAKCAGCHGADGKGSTGPGKALGVHDFTSETVTKMSDADLIGAITAGKDKMPAYGKSLKDTEIKDLVAYIRELGKQK
jgi:cytochrome c6